MVACIVCARPFDAPLTTGLHAGVGVMAAVVVLVVAALTRGALAVARLDRTTAVPADTPQGPHSPADTSLGRADAACVAP